MERYRTSIVKNDDEEYYEEDYTIPIEAIPANTISNFVEEDYIEVTTVSDVYKTIEIDKDGETIEDYELVKSNVKSKRVIWKSEISGIEQVISDKGNLKRNQVKIELKYKDPITIIGKYDEIFKTLFKQPKQEYKHVGFKTW